jgi:tetratricopeptide (TPR) repeat protein
MMVLVLLVLSGLSIVQAQDNEAEYRLREPSAKDYLSALSPILEQLKGETSTDENGFNTDYFAMLGVTWKEIQTKYPDWNNVSYEILADAAPYFRINTSDYLSDHHWEVALIWASLQENKSLLSTQTQFQIHNYSFDVSKIDFNGDGVDELLLTIHAVDDSYKDYWVLEKDSSNPFGYRRIQTPELWSSTNCSFRLVCGGAAQVLELRDLNADGLPEWAIAEGSYCGYGECGGNLLVLGWRNNEIVEIAQTKDFWDLGWTSESGGGKSPLLPPDGSWTFKNIDPDSALELIQQIPFTDNRGCQIVDNRIFDWSSQTQMYVRSKINRTYADDTACSLRLGHEAMGNGDYQNAVTAYERAETLFDKQKTLDDYDREAKQYAQIRLMLAYALANRSEDALNVQESLENQNSQPDIMESLLNAVKVYHTQADQIDLCKAINAAVGEYVQFNTDYNFSTFATTDDVSARGMQYGGGNFDPGSSGCDLGVLLRQMGEKAVLDTSTSFEKQLTGAGWRIIASFKADLNHDGITDGLIWTEESEYTLAYMSTEQGYRASLVFVSKPDTKTQLIVHELNTDENPLLIAMSYDQADEGYNFCGHTPPVGELNISQWNGETFRYVANPVLCEQRTLQQLFPKPDLLQAWRFISNKIFEATYTWNSTKHSFDISSDANFIPDFRDFNQYECFGQPYLYCGFQYDDAAIEAAILRQVLDHSDKDMSKTFLTAVHYSYALALEVLNRPDEALAEYITIYKNAPESAWGKLAALHLECVANCKQS